MKTKELLKVLNLIKPAIAVKDIVESLTYFYFTGKEIIAYNDLIAISHEFPTDFKTFIKAKDLIAIVSKLSAKEISFTPVEDNKIEIKAGGFKATIPTIEDTFFVQRVDTINKSLAKTKFKNLPSNFIQSLKYCQYTASQNETDKTLTCIKVNKDTMVSSDRIRISQATFTEKNKTGEYLFKASICSELINTQPTQAGIGKSWIHFRNKEGCIFSVREVKADYVDYSHLLTNKGEEIKLPKKFAEGIDLVTIFAEETDPRIELQIENNRCFLAVGYNNDEKENDNSARGKAFYRSKKINYNGKPISIKINPEFLHTMLEHTTTMIISKDIISIEVPNFKMFSSLKQPDEEIEQETTD